MPVDNDSSRYLETLSKFTGPLEAVIKVSAGVLALLYVYGLMITNLYLIRLGITDFTIFRVRCVFTGLWACLFVALAGGVPYWLTHLLRQAWRDRRSPGIKWWALLILLFSALMIALSMTSAFEVLRGSSEAWDANFRGLAESLAIFGVVVALTEVGPRNRLGVAFGIFFLLCLFTAQVSRVYPSIRQEFGGGKPVSASLVLTKEGSQAWGRFRPNSDGAELTLLNSIDVLYENEQVVVIRYDKTKYILDRKLISIIQPH